MMTKKEWCITLTLSAIFALRMSGVFMILPILTIYATSLKSAHENLIGIALGIYGITQIIFQLPFGILSDKIGYKRVIIIGLIIFFIGSEITAFTNNIWGLIIGRALQGSGAISSSLIALLLNIVQEHNQTKAMATIGISFGLTFAASIIAGPIITSIFGFHGLFHSMAILTILAIILTHTINIDHPITYFYGNNKTLSITTIHIIKKTFTNIQLIKLNFNIFCLHSILMLNFIVLPKILTHLQFSSNIHWKIYTIIIILSSIIILPYIFYSKIKFYNKKQILIILTSILFVSEFIMTIYTHHRWIFLLGMQLFFIAFNLIETTLPTLISKESPNNKGTTISIYSIAQFLGIGIGGIVGGLILESYGIWMVLFLAWMISICPIIINNTLK